MNEVAPIMTPEQMEADADEMLVLDEADAGRDIGVKESGTGENYFVLYMKREPCGAKYYRDGSMAYCDGYDVDFIGAAIFNKGEPPVVFNRDEVWALMGYEWGNRIERRYSEFRA